MEKVQLALERFLPELRDLQRKKIFSEDEISEIVAKRKAFEVACSKRDVKPVDFLRYLEYETRLEKLRKLRAKRTQSTTKKTLSDHSIAAHITQLHRLSCRRFPASLVLWDAALAHSLTLSSPLLVSKTLSAVIAMHPTSVRYWIMASRWESEGDRKGMGGGNVEGARRLCMRALRFLKGAGGEMEIWREWVRLEVAFVERIRGRAEVLGLTKAAGGGEVIVGVGESKEDQMEVDGEPVEEGPAAVEVPLLPNEDVTASDEILQNVEALSGQDAILDGAIVRVVLDNCLSSFSHSLLAHQHMIMLLRTLPTTLRLPLLAHVYASLRTHFTPTTPSYADATHLVATRSLYDVAYDAKIKEPQLSLNIDDEPELTSPVRVEGEAFVDAVGEVVEEYWKACKGKKGKGKGKEQASIAVWERFCTWLEEVEEESDDENLTVFLTSNLTSALAIAPTSSTLSLLHLRHLLRTTAPHPTILTFAKSLTTQYGSSTPNPIREEIWVARISTVIALGSPEETTRIFVEAEKALPFSGRIWELEAEWIERSGTEDVSGWYEKSIRRVLLTDAVRPIGFESKFGSEGPRDFLPVRYVAHLITQEPNTVIPKLNQLLLIAPTLPLSFLSYILSLPIPSIAPSVEQKFRQSIHAKIVEHPEAGPEEWVAYAEEMLRRGEIVESNKVMQLATRKCSGRSATVLQTLWARVCDA